MSWIANLQPDLILGQSVLGITPEVIRDRNLKGLVLDVDETIVPVRQKQLAPEIQSWAEEIQQIVPLSLVSNNVGYARIEVIAQSLDVPFVASAGKPSRKKLRKAAEAHGATVGADCDGRRSPLHRCLGRQSSWPIHDFGTAHANAEL